MASGCDVRLYMHSGVPVLDVQGEWVAATVRDLAAMVDALVGAGHCEIILNLQRTAAVGAGVLRSLRTLAMSVRAHHGHLDIVGTVEQVRGFRERLEDAIFRISTSESGAISRIKRMPVCVSGTVTTTRLAGREGVHAVRMT